MNRSSKTRGSLKTILWGAAAIGLVMSATSCSESGNSAVDKPGGSASDPLKIGLLMSIKGEDAYAVDSYYNGAALAIELINAAGGFNGKPVDSFRIAAPQDSAGLSSALLAVADKKPNIVVGIPPTALGAISRQVDAVGLPIIGTSSYQLSNDYAAGSKWVFQLGNGDADETNAAARFAVEELGASKIAVLHTNESYGTNGSKLLASAIPAAGGKVFVDSAFSPTTTDMTNPLLDAKGADAIIHWGYPAPMAIQINTLSQQGIATPTITSGSGAIDVQSGAIKGPALKNMYSVLPCNIQDQTRPETKAFGQSYLQKYSSKPDYFAGRAFDAVYIALAAAKSADSLAPDAIALALADLKYTTGACLANYAADAAHIMAHDETIVGFTSDSSLVTKRVFPSAP